MYWRQTFAVLLFCFLWQTAVLQPFYRMSADFAITQKTIDGKLQTIVGCVFYDCSFKQLIYRITTPKKETWIQTDSSIVSIDEYGNLQRSTITFPPEYSLFALCLNQNLLNYGLGDAGYTLQKTEQQSDLLILTWLPPQIVARQAGKILLAQKNKQLYGVVSFDVNNILIMKLFFKNYIEISGFTFPREVYKTMFVDTKEMLEKSVFSNIKVNEPGCDSLYYVKNLK